MKTAMEFDLEKVLRSKGDLRQELAARPLAEKLASLDKLRERALTIRAAKPLLSKAESDSHSSDSDQ